MMAPERYDLIVIGSGPAGEKGAAQAAYFKKRVALVEKEAHLGGTAANTGTLPSKTLRETALFLSGYQHRQLDGLDFRGLKREKLTVRDFMARERLVIDKERNRIQENLRRHNVDLHKGTASFVDAHTISVKDNQGSERSFQADVFLIATGSSPHRPAGYPFEDPRVYDSDGILNLQMIPSSMLVVGGGVVGCEYACMFAVLGIRVTLVEKRSCLVGFLDGEVEQSLRAQMADMGMRILLSDEVAEIRHDQPVIEVQLKSGASLHVRSILVSSGRNGNTAWLDLDRIGLAVDERGRICVNGNYQTSIPHIYAAGDVIGNPALASTSMEQARVAMVHAFQLKHEGNKEQVSNILPYGIYTIPECSMAGETEQGLTQQGIPYVAGKASFANNARGQIIGDSEGFLKLLFRDPDMKLLGVHMIGEQATEIVHVGLTALLMGASAELFIQTCYNYPTLTELYKYATYDALGRKATKQKEVLR